MVTSPFEYYVKVNGFFFSWTDATCILSMLPFTDAWIKDWQLHTRIHVHCLYAAAALFIQAECRVQWGSGPNFKAFRFAWSSTVKVSRVRGPIVFGWSLLLQPKLSHKKINNIYQTHNIYLSPLKKILRGYLLSCHIRIFWKRISDSTRRFHRLSSPRRITC